ncbi:hypothetical protein AAG906_016166 [Vitis piasezkii]
MKPAIGKTYMFIPMTKDVWDAIRETYFDTALADEARRSRNHGILHRDAGFMARTRSQLRRGMGKMENERVFKFLTGLNCELDDVRSRVLSHQSLPSIREVFSEVRREESRRKVILWEHITSRPEASALVTRGPHVGSSPRQSKRTYYEHCKKTGHTKDTCWTLHDEPTDWKLRQPNKAHSHQAST